MTDQEALFVSRAALALMGGFTWVCTTERPAQIGGYVTVAVKYPPQGSDSITEIRLPLEVARLPCTRVERVVFEASHVVRLLGGGELRLCSDFSSNSYTYAVLDILDCRAATRAALVARLMEWSTYVVGDDQ